MKKTLLGIALLFASGTAMAGDTYNGRLTAMSGAGFVTGGYTDGVLYNPSLGASYGEKDDFAVVINGGAMASDDDELLDGLDDLVDFLDELSAISDVQDLDPAMADEAIALLRNVDAKTADIRAGGSAVLAIPNGMMSLAFIAKSRLDASVTSLVDENDYEIIENSVNQPFYPEDLNSSVLTRGAIISEAGVAISKRLASTEDTQVLVGITPKRMVVRTFVYSATVSDFDDDDFDADEFSRESSAANFDAGVTYISGNMRYGIAVRDVMSKEFDTVTGDKLYIEPLSTAAIGYKNGWFTAEVALDLNAAPGFALNGDTRILRAGMELNLLRWIQVRAGMQTDREDTLEDSYSVGLGISPFDTVNLDVSAIKGQQNSAGAAVQLGVRF